MRRNRPWREDPPVLPLDTAPSRVVHRRWLLPTLVWAPFMSLFVFAAAFWGGDTYSHVLFHVFALTLLGWALIELRRTARVRSTSRLRRVLTFVLFVSLPLAILGHGVELVAALVRLVEEGGANVDTDDIFEEGVHAWAANVTVPMMMLSMLTALALVIVTTVQRRKGGDHAEPEVHSLG
jgi:hypothetical protein